MKNKLMYLLLLLMFSEMFSSCASMPTDQVLQPWSRILSSSVSITPGLKVKIEASGSTLPLLGTDELATNRVRDILASLLRRRGFQTDNTNYDYFVKLIYKTERSDKLKVSSYYSSANYDYYNSSSISATGSGPGLGVSLASSVSQLAKASSTNVGLSVDQSLSYIHTMSLEIYSRNGVIIWKGDTTWDSPNLNITTNVVTALQMIISDLPALPTIKPEVREIRDSHINHYYTMISQESPWFTCPALPFRLYLNAFASTYQSMPLGIKDAYALEAYVDLIQTAEFALPDGNENDWKDPLNLHLWGHVTLCGQYLLGPDKKPINVIIELVGQNRGYYIDTAKVITDSEYEIYQRKLASWKKAVSDYRNYFVQN